MPDMKDVTLILSAIEDGDAHAAEELLPLVYKELRKLADQRMKNEKPGQTLQATALVHEAYIRLVGSDNQNWDSRAHFFAAAAEAMRRILIESARRKKRLKRGGDRKRIDLEHAVLTDDENTPSEDLIALDEALKKLAIEEPIKADLVKLRFFAGLSIEQTAEMLNISRATANRYFSYARAWLFNKINE